MKQIYNPYLPLWEYISDGEPHVFDGRVYLYGSHDRSGHRMSSGEKTEDIICITVRMVMEKPSAWQCAADRQAVMSSTVLCRTETGNGSEKETVTPGNLIRGRLGMRMAASICIPGMVPKQNRILEKNRRIPA